MKNKIVLVCICTLFLFFSYDGFSQIEDPGKKIKKETNKRVNKNVDKGIDKTFDKVEDGIKGLFKKKKKKKKKDEEIVTEEQQTETEEVISDEEQEVVVTTPQVTWAKFDFVPGDKVIFEDGPAQDEENGEFPSRWDLVKGNVEIMEVDGEIVIGVLERATFVPYIKNSDKDYLPEVFTIELDAYFEPDRYSQRLYIMFFDKKNQKSKGSKYVTVYINRLVAANSQKDYPDSKRGSRDDVGKWRHISIAYTKGKMKVYMDDTRLINIPHWEKELTGLTITADNNFFIKNIRIAEGGVKYYDRMMQDGKIICTGIKFDVNKATLKPESMGPINEVFELMEKYPDISFSVEGHTDSDGDNDFNQTLSEERAATVKATLIDLGISADRLSSKGWGETKPNDNNNTAEGKANNRRVEFIKQ